MVADAIEGRRNGARDARDVTGRAVRLALRIGGQERTMTARFRGRATAHP
jgi:hypothetical protein